MKPSRHHVATFIAALAGAVALLRYGVGPFIVVVAALLVLISLGVVFPQMRWFGPYVCRGTGARRAVALTFDDGPDSKSTPQLLDLLRDEHVEAAFFCLGRRVEEQPELAARIMAEGHLLENHSYWHNNLTNVYTAQRLQAELEKTQAAIQKVTGSAPQLFRPPMGLSNPRVFKVARALKLTVVGWTARGLDTRLTDPERIVARIVRRLRPGAIILLHDGDIPARRLVATVKRLLDTLRSLGYEVDRLDRMLK